MDAIDRRVLFFGDSHTAGVGDATGLGWVGRVVAAAHKGGAPLTAYGLGVRRQTSVEVAARWEAEAAARLAPEAECKLVLAVGANDTTWEGGAVRVEHEDSLSALGQMLERASERALPAFVVGPAPVGDSAQFDRIEALATGVAALCVERGIPFARPVDDLADSGLWRRELAAGDGAHPGAGGYALLADSVLRAGWLEWIVA